MDLAFVWGGPGIGRHGGCRGGWVNVPSVVANRNQGIATFFSRWPSTFGSTRSTRRVASNGSVVRYTGFQLVVPGATPDDYRRINDAKDFQEVQAIIAEVKMRLESKRRTQSWREVPVGDLTESYFDAIVNRTGRDDVQESYEDEDEDKEEQQFEGSNRYEAMLQEKEKALRAGAQEKEREKERQERAEAAMKEAREAAFRAAREQQQKKPKTDESKRIAKAPRASQAPPASRAPQASQAPQVSKTGDIFKDTIGVSDLTQGRNLRASKGSVPGRIERPMTERAMQNPNEYVDRDETYEDTVQHRDLGKPAGFFSLEALRKINDAGTSVEETYEIMRTEMAAYQDRRRETDPSSHHRNVYDYFAGLGAGARAPVEDMTKAGQSTGASPPISEPKHEQNIQPSLSSRSVSEASGKETLAQALVEVWAEMNAYQSELATLEAEHRLRLKKILDQAISQ